MGGVPVTTATQPTDLPRITIDQEATVRIYADRSSVDVDGDTVVLTLPQRKTEAIGDFLRLTEPLWKP